VLPVVFNLQLEEGDYINVPDFYVYAVTDLNNRTTHLVNGMLAFDYVLFYGCVYHCTYDVQSILHCCNNSD